MDVSSRAEHTVQGAPQSHVLIELLLWAADLAWDYQLVSGLWDSSQREST